MPADGEKRVPSIEEINCMHFSSEKAAPLVFRRNRRCNVNSFRSRIVNQNAISYSKFEVDIFHVE